MQKMWKVVSGCAVMLFLAATAPAVAQGQIANLNINDQDYSIGSESAPVVIVEYASLTCPTCGRFHKDTFPVIKKDYVDTGRVRFIYRDFPLDGVALAASMLARCAGRDNYFGFIELLYDQQDSWATSRDPQTALRTLFALGGMSSESFDKCLDNRDIQNEVLTQRLEAVQTFGVDGTPTLFVNGRRYGDLSVPDLRKILDGLLAN